MLSDRLKRTFDLLAMNLSKCLPTCRAGSPRLRLQQRYPHFGHLITRGRHGPDRRSARGCIASAARGDGHNARPSRPRVRTTRQATREARRASLNAFPGDPALQVGKHLDRFREHLVAAAPPSVAVLVGFGLGAGIAIWLGASVVVCIVSGLAGAGIAVPAWQIFKDRPR